MGMSPWHQLYAAAVAMLERPSHARVTEGAPYQDLRRAVERVGTLIEREQPVDANLARRPRGGTR